MASRPCPNCTKPPMLVGAIEFCLFLPMVVCVWLHIPGYRGETWNPHGGCTPVSEGCKNCWALRQACRFQRLPQYEGTVENGNWTGLINRASDKEFYKPLRWRDPRAIFPCSMSDFFHPGADEWREHIWHTICDTPQHLYLILTKRPERIPECLPSFGKKEWPWPNVWLGASVENQEAAEERIPELLRVPAAKRFLSLEPMLRPIDLSPWLCKDSVATSVTGEKTTFRCATRWVIAGGESGPGARPCHPDWLRSIRNQCQKAEVPYFLKQHGEWEQARTLRDDAEHGDIGVFGLDNQPSIIRESSGWGAKTRGWVNACPLPSERVKVVDGMAMVRVGKKKAGRLLDGRTWSEFPK